MSKIFRILCLTALLLCCASTLSQAQNDAIIVGQIDSASARSVRIDYKRNHFMLEDGSFETLLDGNNVFSFRVKINESRSITLVHRNEWIRLFVTPGDTLKIHFKSKHMRETIAFEGTDAIHNDYLVKANIQISDAENESRVANSLLTASTKAHLRLVDSIYTAKKGFFDAYPTDIKANFSNEFLDFVLNDNTYWRAFNLMEYVKINGLTNSNYEKQVDDSYFNFLFETDNTYHKALNNQNYIKYLDVYLGYIREKSGHGKQTDGDTSEIKTRTVQKIRSKGKNLRVLEEPYLKNDVVAYLSNGEEAYYQNLSTTEKFEYNNVDTLIKDAFSRIRTQEGKYGWVPQSLIENFDKTISDTLHIRRFCYQPEKEFCGFEDNLTGKVLFFTMAKDILLGFMYDPEAVMRQRLTNYVNRNPTYEEYNTMLKLALQHTLVDRANGQRNKVSVPPSCDLERYDRDRDYYAAQLSKLPLETRVINTQNTKSSLAFTSTKAPEEPRKVLGEVKGGLMEAARLKAEADAKAVEDVKLKAQADAKLAADAKIKADADAKLKATDELRLKLEKEAKTKLAEEARLEAETKAAKAAQENRLKAEAEALKLSEEKRLKAEVDAKAAKIVEEARTKAEAAAKAARLADEARFKAAAKAKAEEESKAARLAEDARLKAENEAKAARFAEEALRKAENEAKAAKLAEESRLKADAKAKAEAEIKAQLEAARLAEVARLKAEAEVKVAKLAEENRVRNEAKVKADADEKAARLAEEARIKAEADAKTAKIAEAKRLKAEAKIKAEADAKAAKLAEQARLKVEEAAKAAKLAEENRLQAEAKTKAEAEAKAAKQVLEARLKTEGDAKTAKIAEEKRLKAEADAKAEKLAQETRIKAEAEAKGKTAKLAEENRVKAAANAKAAADVKAAKLAEETRLKAENEAKAAKLAEEARIKAKSEADIKAVRLAEEARLKAKADADAKAVKLAEETRLKVENDAKAAKLAEDNRLKAEAKVKSDALAKADADAKAAKSVEDNRLKAEAKVKTDALAKADADAKAAKLIEDNRLKAEAKVKSDAFAKADADEKAAKLAEDKRLKAETKAKTEALAKADSDAKAAKVAEDNRLKAEAKVRTDALAKVEADAKAAKLAEEARLKAEAKAKAEAFVKLEAGERAARLKAEEEKRLKLAEAKAKLDEETRIKLAETKAKLEEENKIKLAETKAKLEGKDPSVVALKTEVKAENKTFAEENTQNNAKKPRSIDSLILKNKPIFEQNKVVNANGVVDPNVIMNDPNDKTPKNPNETRKGNLIYTKQPDGTFKVESAPSVANQDAPREQVKTVEVTTPTVNDVVRTNEQPKVRFVAPRGVDLDTTQEIMPLMDKLEFDPTGQFVEFKGLVSGDEMPRFTLTDINGQAVSQEEMKNKVIFIDFWASWCGPCIAQFSHAKILMEKYKNEDVLFLFISIDTDPETWKDYLKYNPMAGVHTNDKTIMPINFQVTGIPNSFIIARNGKIAFNSRLKSKINDDRVIQLLLKTR